MTTKNSIKKKKLQTTLGKAAETPKSDDDVEDQLDLSHLQKPIDTSVVGLRDVLSLLQTATSEVKHYLTYECDIMYECRICRTIFRSLANFILHKRNYCSENYNPLDHTNCRNRCQENGYYVLGKKDMKENGGDDELQTIRKSPPKSPPTVKETKKKNISLVLEKLLQKQEERTDLEKIALEDLSNETEKNYADRNDKNNIALEKIDSTNVGVFQTMFKNMAKDNAKIDFMKTEVMELHGVFSSDEAVLGPDGKIHSFETEKVTAKPLIPKSSLICTICNQKFSTKKTLTYHVKYKHNNTRMVYPCPVCKDQFANAWCVFRHLYKIHRKTSTQIRKMRDQIHASAFRKDQIPIEMKDTINLLENTSSDAENQWMENIESDNDLQMCGGCGKRFERKAALHSHSQMCTKRIALCNTIKENNIKQAQEEARNQKLAKINSDNLPKGSEKRKPLIVRKKCLKSNSNQNVTIAEPVVLEKISKDTITKSETALLQEENKTEDLKQNQNAAVCNGDNSNVLPNSTLVEILTVPSLRECESDCDVLSVENDNLSTIRTSINPLDVCSIIGVPATESEKPVSIPNNHLAEKRTEENEMLVCVDDNSNCSLVHVFQDDNSRTLYNRLDADIETTIKEISSFHQAPAGKEKKRKRKRSSSTEKNELTDKLTKLEQESEDHCDKTTLETKAKKYIDTQKFLCLACDVKFTTNHDLMEHMSQHFNWYCYQCRKCNYMSYYEDTCLLHVRKEHKAESCALENTVLPVPNWKALKLSTDLVPLIQKDKPDNNNLQTVQQDTSDSVTRKMIMEVIFGGNVDICNFVDVKRAAPERETRPVRNRTKSIKVVQDDFLYDLDNINKKPESTASKKAVKPLKVYAKKGISNKKGTMVSDYSKKLENKKA